jgi:hypothetical protein
MRGASVDKERSDGGLKSDLVFEDRGGRVMCELLESRENALTRSLGGADAGAFSDRQDWYTCTQTHPVTRFVSFQQPVSPLT